MKIDHWWLTFYGSPVHISHLSCQQSTDTVCGQYNFQTKNLNIDDHLTISIKHSSTQSNINVSTFRGCTWWSNKKCHPFIIAITLSTSNQFSQFLADIHYGKFATRECIIFPPNTVYVTALPCKILTTTLF